MNIRKPVFASATIALVTALATGSVLAIAHSSDQYGSTQDEATNQSTYPSNRSMGSSDSSSQGLGSSDQSSTGLISSPGQSSEQSSQTPPSDNSDSNDGNASSDSDEASDAGPDTSDEQSRSNEQGGSNDAHRMSGSPVSHSAGFSRVNLTTTDTEPSHAMMGPAVDDTATSDTIVAAPSARTTTTMAAPSSESVVVVPAEPDEPRYTPETGDAEYGSKLNPQHSIPPAAGGPSARFNDATGQ